MTRANTKLSKTDLIWFAVALIAFSTLVGWPFAAGMVVASDDVALLLAPPLQGGLGEALRQAWHAALFRPLVVVSAFFVDPSTRGGFPVVLMHVAALSLALLALWKLGQRFLLGTGARWCALALWMLHPATSVSVWQMDTVSQTASACVGMWFLVVVTDAWAPRHRELVLTAIVVLGLLTKETFVGWLAAGLLLEALHPDWRRRGDIAIAASGGLLYLVCRLSVLGTGVVARGDERYALHFDVGVFKNAAMITLGGLAYGPIHALHLLNENYAAWWIAALGTLGAIAIQLTSVYHSRSRAFNLAGLCVLVLIASGPVLLMGHVSELYLMGPNALVALSLAHSLTPPRRISIFLACLLVVSGLLGVASRAYHFGLTWKYSRILAERVDAASSAGKLPSKPCQTGFSGHSTYVTTPLDAVNIPGTSRIAHLRGHPLRPDWAARLDCRDLEQRQRW